MKYTYFFLFFILTFIACQNENIPERVTFKSTPIDSVYQDFRPEIQSFSVANNQPNQIKATKGTEIFIPANSFVDAGGNPINGDVEVKLVEAFSMDDFITSGLVTQSNGQLLVSNGMINIDATAEGEKVALADGKELTVSMPIMERTMDGFEMFTGSGQNWEVDSSMMEEDYLIPVPLELLYLQGNYNLIYYIEGGYFNFNYLKENGISLEDRKYENTLIATKAFEVRLMNIFMMTHNMSLFEAKKFYLGEGNIKDWKYNLSIWNIYFQNLDKPIEEFDKLAKQEYIQYFNKNEEALKLLIEDIKKANKAKDLYIPWIYSNGSIVDFSKENYLSILDDYSFKEKGKIKIINDYGIDLSSKEALNELKEKGINFEEISELLSYHLKQNSLIENLKRKKIVFEESMAKVKQQEEATRVKNKEQEEIRRAKAKQLVKDLIRKNEDYQAIVFSLNQLGWINCDRFYDSPNAKGTKILAFNSSQTSLNFIEISLVFPKLNARLLAFKNKDGKYAFTRNGIYSKLPIGEKAIIIGISFQNGSIYYAAQPIVIEENMEIDLNMKITSKETLHDELSKLVD